MDTDRNKAAESGSSSSVLLGPDSRLVYITCHLLSCIYAAAVVAAFIWLAYELRNGWVLLGLALCMRSYKHDFNRVKPLRKEKSSRPNIYSTTRRVV